MQRGARRPRSMPKAKAHTARGGRDAEGEPPARPRLLARAAKGSWALAAWGVVAAAQYSFGRWQEARRVHAEEQRYVRAA